MMLWKLNEVIFANRNKKYGAYQLRKNYRKALLIGLSGAILPIVFLTLSIFWQPKKNIKTPPQDSEMMLKVQEIELMDIESLPVLVQEKYEMPIIEPSLSEQNTTQEKEKEIEVTAEKKEEPAKKEEVKKEESTKKDTVSQKNSEKTQKQAATTYTPDVWSIYVKKNMKYPEQALKERKECSVVVVVIIQDDGSLKIEKDRPLYSCEDYFYEEVKRLIQNAPPFIPAKDAEGNPKKRLTMKILFELPK
ncbi:MAG: energy transducer TonB [Thermonemataceae bacterium]|nr:energy transducer TonB [Thermonemataceae bacterium]